MDLRMKVQQQSESENPVWDVEINKGIVPIITGKIEHLQNAVLAGFLELGSIKQLPEAGVDWPGFITGVVTFGEIDSAVRDSLLKAGRSDFYPQYELEDEKLIMTIGTEEQ